MPIQISNPKRLTASVLPIGSAPDSLVADVVISLSHGYGRASELLCHINPLDVPYWRFLCGKVAEANREWNDVNGIAARQAAE